MIIRELHIQHFGKFDHKEILLQPGINIIYGQNEAGKSTVHFFIRSMLFGTERLRGKGAANDICSRYQPWEGSRDYEGLMIFEHEGRVYRIYRSFQRNNPVFRIFDHETGQEIRLSTGRIDELIPGLTEADYCNTISIEQQACRISDQFATSLQTYLANMSFSGDESIDIARAESYLSQEERKIKGRMPVQELSRLKDKLESYDEKNAAGIFQDIDTLRQQEKELERRIQKQQEQIEKVSRQEQRARAEGIRLLEQRRGILQSLKKEEEEAQLRGSRMSLWKQRSFLCFIILTVIAAGMMLWQLGFSVNRLIYKGMTGAILGAAIFCLAKTSFKRPKDDIDLDSYRKQLDALQCTIEPYIKKYGPKMANAGEAERLRASLDEWRIQLAGITKQREKYEWELEKQQETASARLVIQETYDSAARKNRELKTELEAVALAKKVISDLAREIHGQLGSRLNRRVSEIFEEISGNTGKKLLIDDQLNIHMDGVRQMIPLNRLSAASVDQIYLALRFCAADILFQGTGMPFIADDCFAYYDDRRLENMLSWLSRQERSQIILLTCHHRETEILEALGIDYAYTDLSTD